MEAWVATILAILAHVLDPVSELRKGKELVAVGNLVGAQAEFRRIVQTYPGWGLAYIELAEVLLESQSDRRELAAVVGNVRRLEPSNPRTWLISGKYYQRVGDVDNALHCYRQAVLLRPEMSVARRQLALTLINAHKQAEAIEHLLAYLRGMPNDCPVRLSLARIYENVGKISLAEKQFKMLINCAPKNGVYRQLFTDFLKRNHKPEAKRIPSGKIFHVQKKKMRTLLPSSR
jgi:Tfp pilus assembly protein PilF